MDLSFKAKNLSLNMFQSEEFYWLTTSLALSFALEELEAYYEKFPHVFSNKIQARGCQKFKNIFKKGLSNQEFLVQEIGPLKDKTLVEIKKLLDFICRDCYLFSPLKGLILGKTYAIYFLVYKLIELRKQKILHKKEAEETCILLEVVIKDYQELEKIEKTLKEKHTLDRDQKVYLYSHYQRDRLQWLELSMDLELLANGFIKYKYYLK